MAIFYCRHAEFIKSVLKMYIELLKKSSEGFQPLDCLAEMSLEIRQVCEQPQQWVFSCETVTSDMKYFYCISTAGGAALHEVQGIDLGPSYRCPAAAWTLALFMQLVLLPSSCQKDEGWFFFFYRCVLSRAKQTNKKTKKHTKAVIGEKLNVDAVVHRPCFGRK